MPGLPEIVGGVVRLVGDVLGASSLRFELVPTIAVLGILLVFLQLVARPVTRWVTADAGALTGVGRAMALAAEAGTDAVVSLGGAGVTRATDAFARLQTLAALPILGHVARAAARSGVPLRVLTNDPLAAVLAHATVDAAHAATATLERTRRSRIVFVGEGRPVMAGLPMTAQARPAAAFAAGSLREEAQLHLQGLRSGAGSVVAASAEPAQAPTLILGSTAAVVGPGIFEVPADLRSDVHERTTVMAANRLILMTFAAIVIGALLAATGVIDASTILIGDAAE